MKDAEPPAYTISTGSFSRLSGNFGGFSGECLRTGHAQLINLWNRFDYGRGTFVLSHKDNLRVKKNPFERCIISTKFRRDINGIIGMILLENIFEYLNMTLETREIISNALYYPKIDMNVGKFGEAPRIEYIKLFTLQQNWFVAKPGTQPKWMFMIQIFNPYAWLAILVSIFIVPIVIWLHSLIYMKYSQSDMSSYLITSWQILLNVNSNVLQRVNLRGFFLGWIFYCLCMNIIFQAYLKSYFSKSRSLKQIEIYNENLTLHYDQVMTDSNNVYAVFGRELPSHLKITNDEQTAIEMAMNNGKSALLINERLLTKNYAQLCGRSVKYAFQKIKEKEVFTYFYIQSPLISYYISDRFHGILQRLLESGIAEKIVNYVQSGYSDTIADVNPEDGFAAVSLEHIQFAFYLLTVLHCNAAFVFLCEILLCKLRQIKTCEKF